MRNRADAEQQARQTKDALKLVRPEMQTVYSLRLALRAFLRWERAGFQGAPPSHEDVASEESDWVDSIFLAGDWLQFHRDWYKRPSWLQD